MMALILEGSRLRVLLMCNVLYKSFVLVGCFMSHVMRVLCVNLHFRLRGLASREL